jgi:hypothetical protein
MVRPIRFKPVPGQWVDGVGADGTDRSFVPDAWVEIGLPGQGTQVEDPTVGTTPAQETGMLGHVRPSFTPPPRVAAPPLPQVRSEQHVIYALVSRYHQAHRSLLGQVRNALGGALRPTQFCEPLYAYFSERLPLLSISQIAYLAHIGEYAFGAGAKAGPEIFPRLDYFARKHGPGCWIKMLRTENLIPFAANLAARGQDQSRDQACRLLFFAGPIAGPLASRLASGGHDFKVVLAEQPCLAAFLDDPTPQIPRPKWTVKPRAARRAGPQAG